MQVSHKGNDFNLFKHDKLKKIVRNIVKFLLPLFFGVAIFAYLYSHLNVEEIINILRSGINYNWILLSMLFGLFSHVLRALRWRLQLLSLGDDPGIRRLTNAIFGTYAVNLVFPRLGEVWRCGYISRSSKMPFTQVLGSVVSDRLSDTIAVILLTGVVFLLLMPVFFKFLSQYPSLENSLHNIVISPWTYFSVILFALFAVWIFRKNKEHAWVIKIRSVVENLWSGFITVVRMKNKIGFLVYSLLIWLCYFLQLYVCLFAFNFSEHLGVMPALTMFVMGSISMGLPVQGGVGPWHFAIVATLVIYGIGESRAGAFAFVAHGAQMVLIVLLGLYTMFSIMLENKKDIEEKDIQHKTI